MTTTASQPPADPVHALRARLAGAPPGVHAYLLARQPIAAQMIDGAATEGDRVTDLGPLPPWAPDPGPAAWLTVGTRGPDGRWLDITKGCERLARAVADLERGLS